MLKLRRRELRSSGCRLNVIGWLIGCICKDETRRNKDMDAFGQQYRGRNKILSIPPVRVSAFSWCVVDHRQ